MPIAAGVALLLTYNKLRFDAWLDFGRHYQLTWIAFGSSPTYLPANVWSYAFRPGALRCTFPYLFSIPDMGARALPGWLHTASGYIVYEPVVGWLLAVPGRGWRPPPRCSARAASWLSGAAAPTPARPASGGTSRRTFH